MDLPTAFQARMKTLLGEQYPLFVAEYDNPPKKALRLNSFKPCPAALTRFPLTPMPYGEDCYYYEDARPGADILHDAGAYYIQEPSAMFPVSCIPIRKGWKVLDVCAAPGGKSGQLASAVGASGFLLSNEIMPLRAKILLSNAERLGLTNTAVTMLPSETLATLYRDSFDAVLVDAPCSGEGMFRKEPDALKDWSEATVDNCAKRSAEILANAACCVKVGGYLLYSTCTFAPDEDEINVAKFLKTHEDFELIEPCFPTPYAACGYPQFGNAVLSSCRRLYPHLTLGEGQFAALMVRKQGENNPAKQKSGVLPLTKAEIKIVGDFFKSVFSDWETFDFARYGEGIYILPSAALPLPSFKMLSPGVKAGTIEKNRFIPHHQLFSAYGGRCLRKAELIADSPLLSAYLSGNEIQFDLPDGWGAITVEGCPLGGFKAVDGRLKNHYPKGLRRNL